jgi:TPP-dependent pyruvate/acetoin dehydrogenase alpha subunit
MTIDLWALYALMDRSRRFERAVGSLWQAGLISGEMHTGLGEEGIAAGVVSQLQPDDALALDHRGTAPLLMRDLDPVLLLREFLGRPDGLCRGQGGHMHLFWPERLSASSGIVGAAGPAAAGFALAAQHLRPGSVAVAFFGEGALNQGMLLESLNLAAVWQLPVVFVCKDNSWCITTPAHAVTAGDVAARAQGFGLPVWDVDGSDVEAVYGAAGAALDRARRGAGPSFLHARCAHLEGHFLGDQLLQTAQRPWSQPPAQLLAIVTALLRPGGAPLAQRVQALLDVLGRIRAAARDHGPGAPDPHARLRDRLRQADEPRLEALEEAIASEVRTAVQTALAG